MPENPETEELDEAGFARLLADVRPALRGYILSVIPHPDAAEDVTQETSVFLWENRAHFIPGTNFKAWAFKTGYFKALSHRRELQRNKVVTLSEDVIHRIAGAAEDFADQADRRIEVLQGCLGELRPADRRLLQSKYVERRSLTDQAHELNVPPNRLQKTISRLRLALRHCIKSRLSSRS